MRENARRKVKGTGRDGAGAKEIVFLHAQSRDTRLINITSIILIFSRVETHSSAPRLSTTLGTPQRK